MRHLCEIRRSPSGPPLAAILGTSSIDLAILRGLQWPNGAVLGVGFMERTDQGVRDLILYHMNAWGRRGTNIQFAYDQIRPVIRITRARGQGYWSYLGVDNLYIPAGEPTMALEGIGIRTARAEVIRVVRHEAGHALGFPHEHSRAEIVARLDPAKVIAHFKRYQGWDEQTIRDQILTPIPNSALLRTRLPESNSIMTYSFPASLTRNNVAIPGGSDITELDGRFAASVYKKPVQP